MLLNFEEQHICTSSYHSGEQFGDWHESYVNYLTGVSISKTKYGEPIDFEVSPGDTVFAIYAVWSSGDSFGYADGDSTDIVCVFKTLEKAQAALKELQKEPENWTAKITLESGKILEYHKGWVGYFESLDSLEIKLLVVGS